MIKSINLKQKQFVNFLIKEMKQWTAIGCLCFLSLLNFNGFAQEKVSEVDIKDLYVRDPYIVTDHDNKVYYLYKSIPASSNTPNKATGVELYKSKDLKRWQGPYTVFTTPADNWITGVIWAPEVHYYRGKYYLFATMNSDIEWKKQRASFPNYFFRGTQIFHADKPEGPFLPFDNKEPHTPMDRMALDGTLWVEDGIPYMIYCHEWVQIEDGTMELVQLEKDLSKPVGESVTLFNASVAPWSTGNKQGDGTVTYVTDGCFLYRTKKGKLLMIWSSFKNGKYAIGIAESTTGKVKGPWKQQTDLLFEEHGGHGMLFKTLEGKLMLTFHGPNSPGGSERMKIFEVEDAGNTLLLKKQLFN